MTEAALDVEVSGTIFANVSFDAEIYAKNLRSALNYKGWNIDQKSIIYSLTSIDNEQRQNLKKAYRKLNPAGLEAEIKYQLAGNFAELTLLLLKSTLQFRVEELQMGLKWADQVEGELKDFPSIPGNGCVLVEVLVTAELDELVQIEKEYEKEFRSSFSDDLKSKLRRHNEYYQLCLWLKGDKSDKSTVKAIFKPIEDRFKRNGESFQELLWNRSRDRLAEVLDDLKDDGTDWNKVISENYKRSAMYMAMGTLIRILMDPYEYFANRIHSGLTDEDDEDEDLMRVIVGRSEKDLNEIKRSYKVLTGRNMESDVNAYLSGQYKEVLLRMINQPA